MPGRKSWHSDKWWSTAPPYVVRCQGTYKSTGEQCRRVAIDGSVVCDQHGGAAPQVLRRAAERIQFTADDAARRLVEWMNDPSVDMRERVKIAQDMLDRGGLAASHLIKLMPVTNDPVEQLFQAILSESDGLMVQAPETPVLAASRAAELEELIGPAGRDDDIVDAEIVETVPPMRRFEDAPKQRNPTIPPKHIREGLDLI
jgi:hypothetical protein